MEYTEFPSTPPPAPILKSNEFPVSYWTWQPLKACQVAPGLQGNEIIHCMVSAFGLKQFYFFPLAYQPVRQKNKHTVLLTGQSNLIILFVFKTIFTSKMVIGENLIRWPCLVARTFFLRQCLKLTSSIPIVS